MIAIVPASNDAQYCHVDHSVLPLVAERASVFYVGQYSMQITASGGSDLGANQQGSQPDRFSKAINSGADIVVIDLEDAVEVDAKADARRAVASWTAPDRKVLLRVNANGTPWFTEDAQIAKLRGIAGIVLPKAESAADVVALVSLTKTKIPVFPLIETARGMWNVHGLRQRCNFSSLSEPLGKH